MSRHDPMVRLHHMLDHAREAVEMVRNRSRTDLDTDRMLNLALVRLMEIVGEAAARIPEEVTMADKGYVNPQLLWTPAELHSRLNDPNLCVVDTRSGEEYAQGHIPGAHTFDLFGISLSDTDPAPLKAFSWMIEYLMSFRGVAADKTVVFYGDVSDVRATRGFWFLEYCGHRDAHVLDGGIRAWREAGYPVTAEAQVASYEATLQPQTLATYTDRKNKGSFSPRAAAASPQPPARRPRAARRDTMLGAKAPASHSPDRRSPPQIFRTGRPKARDPGEPLRRSRTPSSAGCLDRAPPRRAWRRAAAAGLGCVLWEPPALRASSGRRRRRARGERWQRRGENAF